MTSYDPWRHRLNNITREIGKLITEEVASPTYGGPRRPWVAFELSETGAEVQRIVQQYAQDRVTEYAMREHPPITMEVKYTDQPIFDELVGDLWEKAYRQGIEDERTATALDLGIQANRTNPYRSRP